MALYSFVLMPLGQHGSRKAIEHWWGSRSSLENIPWTVRKCWGWEQGGKLDWVDSQIRRKGRPLLSPREYTSAGQSLMVCRSPARLVRIRRSWRKRIWLSNRSLTATVWIFDPLGPAMAWPASAEVHGANLA